MTDLLYLAGGVAVLLLFAAYMITALVFPEKF